MTSRTWLWTLSFAVATPACIVVPARAPYHAAQSPLLGGTPGAPETECRMGSDGVQACGYNCRMGSDGHMACANTPDGVCAMGSNGRVSCSQVQTPPVYSGPSGAAQGPPPECRMGSNGVQTCGYNCRMGSNGRFYCASTPNGHCAMNADGSWTCP